MLTLQVNASGAVSGTFDSGVGDDGQPIVVQVQGRTLGDRITFNVVYEQFGTVVSWVGQLTGAANDQLETVWLHASEVPDSDEPQWLWGAVRTGADTFLKQ